MIILLNGPFGIGKSATSRLLVSRMPGSGLYDLETNRASASQAQPIAACS